MKLKLDLHKLKNMMSMKKGEGSQQSKGKGSSTTKMIIISSAVTIPILGFYLYSEFNSNMLNSNSLASSDSLSLTPDIIQEDRQAKQRSSIKEKNHKQSRTSLEERKKKRESSIDKKYKSSTKKKEVDSRDRVVDSKQNRGKDTTLLTINSKKGDIKVDSRVEKVENKKENKHKIVNPLFDKDEQKLIQKIEKEVLSDRVELMTSKDPLATVDESIIKNREYSIYLDKKLENLKKLAEYYKRMNRLRELFNLYKQAYNGDSSKQAKDRNEEQLKVIETAVRNSVSPLVSKIDYIQRRLSDIEQQTIREKETEETDSSADSKSFEDFSSTIKSALVYTMDGEYIVVLKINGKDIILHRGDNIAGYKIEDIKNSSVVFKKGNRLYYYTIGSEMNGYKVNKIKLASSRLEFEKVDRNRKKKSIAVREYNKPITPSEKAKQELENRLRRF